MYIFIYTVSIKAFYLSINFIRFVFSPATRNETFLRQIFWFSFFFLSSTNYLDSSSALRNWQSSVGLFLSSIEKLSFLDISPSCSADRGGTSRAGWVIVQNPAEDLPGPHALPLPACASRCTHWCSFVGPEIFFRTMTLNRQYVFKLEKKTRARKTRIPSRGYKIPSEYSFFQSSRRWRTFPRYNFYKPFMGLCSRIWNMERKRKNLEILFTRR